MPLQKQTIHIPLAAGVNTKDDARALRAPALAVCQNAEFDEHGGLQPRKPFAKIASHDDNTIADIRRLAVYEGELVAFTETEVWSYGSTDGRWINRGEHLAVKIEEESLFTNEAEQFDCDRAEHSGIAFFCWTQNVAGVYGGYIAALDTETGSVVMDPTLLTLNNPTCRLVATTNKVILIYEFAAAKFRAHSYEPLTRSYVSAEKTIASPVSFDVVAEGDSVHVAVSQGTQYTVATVSEAPAWSSVTVKARTANGPTAIAVAPNGVLAVARHNGVLVEGDILTNGHADTHINLALGGTSSPENQITAAFRSVQDSGQYRCYVFWHQAETTAFMLSESNYMDDGGSVGSEAAFVRRAGIASSAFDYDGSVYVWMTYGASVTDGAQLQNTYYLYRDDGRLITKAVQHIGGGYPVTDTGHLPSVQDLGGGVFAWCGIERRIVPAGSSLKQYAARSPREIKFTFDHNDARRAVQLGRTLYISGMVCQYDGRGVTEVGFNVFPEASLFADTATAGLLSGGSYTWKDSQKWTNAKGEVERSTSENLRTATITASKKPQAPNIRCLHITLKTGTNGEVSHEIWRTVVDPVADAPFYLVTSKDPSTTGDNSYLENDPTALEVAATYDDNLADTTLITKEINPENGLSLESVVPPVAHIIAATQDRIFLAGIAGNPYLVQYSKLRGDGEIASFHDALRFEVPPTGGAVTGLAFLNETLVVFCAKSIYMLPGDGLDNSGAGQNYGPARVISIDVGATNADRIAVVPQGILFHSQKGWYLLNRGWTTSYVGAPVEDFNDDDFVSVSVIEDQHQVRCMSTSRCLVWDYLVDQWSEWTIGDAIDAVIFDGAYHYAIDDASDNQVKRQQADWTENDYPSTTFDGAHGVPGSGVITVPSTAGFASSGTLDLGDPDDPFENSETDVAYTGKTATTFTGVDALAETHADGDMITPAIARTLLYGSHAAGSTSLTVYSVAPTDLEAFKKTGALLLSEGLAEEETVSYNLLSHWIPGFLQGFLQVSPLQNTHADDATVSQVLPELYTLDVETPWIKFADLQGFARVYWFHILGEYLGAHALRVRIARDYFESDSGGVQWEDDKVWTPYPITTAGLADADADASPDGPLVGAPLMVRVGPSVQKVSAIKIRITALDPDGAAELRGRALKLTGLAFEIGLTQTLYRGLSANSKE